MTLPDPALINGDTIVSADERRAYLQYHAQRNIARNRDAQRLGAQTKAIRSLHPTGNAWQTPARCELNGFFQYAAERLGHRFDGGEVTVLDIGCGAGRLAQPLSDAGFAGSYIGVDAEPHPRWDEITGVGGFGMRFIQADAESLDLAGLPPIDLLVSSTALEHIERDAHVVRRFGELLSPRGVQIHFVPATASLPLYGPHGWRQYSPLCLREMFPGATIYRFGGPLSNLLHRKVITPIAEGSTNDRRRAHPRLWRFARATSLRIDRLLGNPSPSMYGVCSVDLERERRAPMPAARLSPAA